MKAFAVISTIVCAILFYFMEMEILKLREENMVMKYALNNERFRFELTEKRLDMYEHAFARIERVCPDIGNKFDYLINPPDKQNGQVYR